jgi:hypothetical protein
VDNHLGIKVLTSINIQTILEAMSQEELFADVEPCQVNIIVSGKLRAWPMVYSACRHIPCLPVTHAMKVKIV